MKYPMAGWLEIPALATRASATAAEHGLGDDFRVTIAFNGGVGHRE